MLEAGERTRSCKPGIEAGTIQAKGETSMMIYKASRAIDHVLIPLVMWNYSDLVILVFDEMTNSYELKLSLIIIFLILKTIFFD